MTARTSEVSQARAAQGIAGPTPDPVLQNAHRPRAPNRKSYPFGAPACVIYRPSPSVKQAGRGPARPWVLEFEPAGKRWVEPLMGWTATDDAYATLRLSFPSLLAAVNYAELEGLTYQVIEPPRARPVRKDPDDGIAASVASRVKVPAGRSPQPTQ